MELVFATMRIGHPIITKLLHLSYNNKKQSHVVHFTKNDLGNIPGMIYPGEKTGAYHQTNLLNVSNLDYDDRANLTRTLCTHKMKGDFSLCIIFGALTIDKHWMNFK